MSPVKRGIHYSQCDQCGQPVRQAASCPVCGRSCCRWGCYAHHVARHLAAPPANRGAHAQQPGRNVLSAD